MESKQAFLELFLLLKDYLPASRLSGLPDRFGYDRVCGNIVVHGAWQSVQLLIIFLHGLMNNPWIADRLLDNPLAEPVGWEEVDGIDVIPARVIPSHGKHDSGSITTAASISPESL